MHITVRLDGEQRHAVLMALGRFAIDRPMFEDVLGKIAETMLGRDIFEHSKALRREERRHE